MFDALFARFADEEGAALGELVASGRGASVAGLLLRGLPSDSPVQAFLRRLLLAGDPVGTAMFRRLYRASRSMVQPLIAAGLLQAGGDSEMRIAILMINDAALLLREQLAAVLGIDPLGAEGATR